MKFKITFLAIALFFLNGCSENKTTPVEEESFNPNAPRVFDVGTVGTDIKYIKIQPPILPTNNNEVLITEVFSYSSPTSFSAQKFLNVFKHEMRALPINYQLIPLVNPGIQETHATMFFSNQNSNILPESHFESFEQLHKFNNRLDETPDISNHFARVYNLNYYDYKSLLASAEIKTKIEQTRLFLRRAKIFSAPAFIINGRYIVNPKISGSLEKMFEALTILSNKELERTTNP